MSNRLRYNKFGNKRVKIDGYTFASKVEARCYSELKLLQRAGKISTIQPQWPLTLTTTDANGVKHKVATHKVDFRVFDCETKQFRLIECKGRDHADGRLRRKWAQIEHGIVIEVRR